MITAQVDSMSHLQDRKLTALALCNLLPTNDPGVLRYLGQVINVCVGVLSASAEGASHE